MKIHIYMGYKHAEEIVDKFKKAQKQREKQKESLDGRLKTIENNLQKLMNHLGVK